MPESSAPEDSEQSALRVLATGPEIFVGLVSPIGVGGGTIEWALKQALEEISYTLKVVKVIDELGRVKPRRKGVGLPFPDINAFTSEEQRYEVSIGAGDAFCKLMGGITDSGEGDWDGKGQDALVALAIRRIVRYRSDYWLAEANRQPAFTLDPDVWPFTPLPRHAYLFRSLKRAGEVARLRRVYGSAFVLISAYSPREVRVDRLSRKIASSNLTFSPEYSRQQAEKLIKQDDHEAGISYGQDVRHAYAMADFFLDASANPADITRELRRFSAMLFSYQFNTPTPDEQGMALAYLAAFRSSHLSRQVGAAITRQDGTVVSVGCNEVPKTGGGGYWSGDQDDARDFHLRKNTSLEIRHEAFLEIIHATWKRLCELGALTEQARADFDRDPGGFIDRQFRTHPTLKDSRLMDVLEFDRSVHAEMMAIGDAARYGVRLEHCTLYTTTFPCHNCARHIVSSGIQRVVYIHPYEKSLTKRLHGDAIGIDLSPHTGRNLVRFDSFVGISPNLYYPLFAMGKRRGDGERWMRIAHWDRSTAQPRLRGEPLLYIRNEKRALRWLLRMLKNHDLFINGEPYDDPSVDDSGAAGSSRSAHG